MSHPKEYKLFVDHEKYNWNDDTISGAQLRELAGIPENVQIFQHVPGHPDVEILDDTVVNLEKQHGPVKFSTQSPGSQAG